MARGRLGTLGIAALALGLWACSGGGEVEGGARPGPDGGPGPTAEAPIRSYTTELGALDGQRAFAIASAQALDGAGSGDVGFQASDLTQCGPAGSGGSGVGLETTHVLTGYLRKPGGGAVAPGKYPVGEVPGSDVQASLQVVEQDRASGQSVTYTADSGTITFFTGDNGKLNVSLDVRFAPVGTAGAETLTGQFSAMPCHPGG